MTDRQMTNEDDAIIAELAREAVDAIDAERMADMLCDEVQDELQPDLLAQALEMTRFDDVAAAEISDSIYGAISDRYSVRWEHLAEDGLV